MQVIFMGRKRKQKKSRAHLTIEDRSKIEYGLNSGHSIRSIAKEIGKDHVTVMREIERNGSFVADTIHNDCEFMQSCTQHGVCGRIDCRAVCGNRCRKTCFNTCSLYKKTECKKLLASPHVCNGCKNDTSKHCSYDKYFYRAAKAQKVADEQLHERNAGFDLTPQEFLTIDRIITSGILKGQAPYHVVQSNLDELSVSLSTVYRLIDAGKIGAKNIDLKVKVKLRPRNSQRQKKHAARVAELKLGRQYDDYLEHGRARCHPPTDGLR